VRRFIVGFAIHTKRPSNLEGKDTLYCSTHPLRVDPSLLIKGAGELQLLPLVFFADVDKNWERKISFKFNVSVKSLLQSTIFFNLNLNFEPETKNHE
jgi:hypothetical protein